MKPEYALEISIDLIKNLKAQLDNTLLSSLGIELLELNPERVRAKMPVDHRTRQPFGLLHGGASAALAETVASAGGLLNINYNTQIIVGIELNINHLKSKKDGFVTGLATPLKRGNKIQVWNISIHDENEVLIAVARCTLAVLDKGK